MQETGVWSLGGKGTLYEEMATHSSSLSWEIPWTEEPGGLQPTGSQRIGHDWATNTHRYPQECLTVTGKSKFGLHVEYASFTLTFASKCFCSDHHYL